MILKWNKNVILTVDEDGAYDKGDNRKIIEYSNIVTPHDIRSSWDLKLETL